ncbi:MAG TPA: 3'(2'),5'-bisphosphate nucleotidase CysQ [Micromonosporaceae bacterium]|nr:3'(2'),5'-bisphosphate nucleotidase CysQ [Micromonosporaceae bacterium]
MTELPPATDSGLAAWLAGRAGELLLGLREEMGFDDAAALRDAGDKSSHEFLVGELTRWRPADAVLSEEGVDDPRRLAADRVWIVDPLDGTREFGEPGRTDWAVHVGLWCRKPSPGLCSGAIALPAQHRVLSSVAAPAYPPMIQGRRVLLAASRTRPPAFLETVAGMLEADLVPMGSAGAKIAAVIEGTVDAYVHAGGQYEWDSAAPVAVALATGLHASRLDGSPLEYNREDPRLPDLVVCRKDLAPRLLAAVSTCL